MRKARLMPEKYTSFIELVNAWLGGAFTTLFAAVLGRAMWHGNEARKGRRKFFGIELFWELPVAIGMAVIGESAASYFSFGQTISTGLIALLAYLGPRGVEAIILKWVDRRMAD
ncbi:conserved hypothetical protein [Agrobacterium tomkonis CFBP 6623]|uniref:LydA holin phage, holin superfamily III n=2 Tax=Agrobacterium TaxID=357 RepID=A0A1S7NN96_9HYPH|nr:conserved hypothetical protein [Agrobacterium tomkonis CFBP 6623]